MTTRSTFHYAAFLGKDEARYVEAAFTAHEVEAISGAVPEPGAHDLITAWHESGRPLAIVSNNSAPAISAYLDLYDLRALIDVVSARRARTLHCSSRTPTSCAKL